MGTYNGEPIVTIYDLLDIVRERPGMWLGSPNIEYLFVWIQGVHAHTSQAIRSPAALLTFTASMVGSPLEPAALKAQGLGSDVARCMWRRHRACARAILARARRVSRSGRPGALR
jgi:hypothetical protein